MRKEVVDIFDISYEGAGVGKVNGQVCFVPKTLLNEKVEVEITKEKSSFLIGQILNIISPSEKRIDAKCPYFSICGGCDLQQCDYETEKQIKKNIIQNEFKRIGFEEDIEVVESSERFGYRNKVKFEIRDGKLGYHKSKSHDFFEIKNCTVATQDINDVIASVEEFVKENELKNAQAVYIKKLQNSIGICFLFDKKEASMSRILKRSDILTGHSVFFAFGEILEDNKTKVYCVLGKDKLVEKIDGKETEFDVSAFNQINENVEEKLYEYVCQNVKDERIVNAYSGQGYLTYLISKRAKFVYGIEYQVSAHKTAEKLKDKNEEYKIENICGKVEDSLQDVLKRDRIDSIVLDPAREGCQKSVTDEILKSQVEKIVYVSCNFSTLIRDIKNLEESYRIESVKVFDMFPCTANMETVAILRKKA